MKVPRCVFRRVERCAFVCKRHAAADALLLLLVCLFLFAVCLTWSCYVLIVVDPKWDTWCRLFEPLLSKVPLLHTNGVSRTHPFFGQRIARPHATLVHKVEGNKRKTSPPLPRCLLFRCKNVEPRAGAPIQR